VVVLAGGAGERVAMGYLKRSTMMRCLNVDVRIVVQVVQLMVNQ
jgi:hypothetical protein